MLSRAHLAALAGLAAVAVVLVVLAAGSDAQRVAGMPAAVARQVGGSPVVVTLHGSLIGLLSPPMIDQLAALETAVARQPGVVTEYGPVRWLRSRLAALRAQIARGGEPAADAIVRDGGTGGLSLQDANLLTTLVLGAGETPVRTVRWLFPDAQSGRIFVRPAGGAAVERRLRSLVAASGLDATVS